MVIAPVWDIMTRFVHSTIKMGRLRSTTQSAIADPEHCQRSRLGIIIQARRGNRPPEDARLAHTFSRESTPNHPVAFGDGKFGSQNMM